MFSLDDLPVLDRRALMRHAILLAGGGIAAASSAGALAKATKKTARFFSPAQMAVLGETMDIIIPRTDTPGAKDAGVPEYFDGLMRDWANAEHQAQFKALADELGGLGLMKLAPAARIQAVRTFDAAKLDAGDPVYFKFKELVLTLYYLSEAGATKELRYELIPGKWEPSTEMSDDTRAWAV